MANLEIGVLHQPMKNGNKAFHSAYTSKVNFLQLKELLPALFSSHATSSWQQLVRFYAQDNKMRNPNTGTCQQPIDILRNVELTWI